MHLGRQRGIIELYTHTVSRRSHSQHLPSASQAHSSTMDKQSTHSTSPSWLLSELRHVDPQNRHAQHTSATGGSLEARILNITAGYTHASRAMGWTRKCCQYSTEERRSALRWLPFSPPPTMCKGGEGGLAKPAREISQMLLR
eukprot:4618363-Prymnesium_polylepis.1